VIKTLMCSESTAWNPWSGKNGFVMNTCCGVQGGTRVG
jgi:hypothetical protein